MANAKQCDVCGKFYCVPDLIREDCTWAEDRNSSMIRLLRRCECQKVEHNIFHYDACDECLQDVMDYILTKQSAWKEKENKT